MKKIIIRILCYCILFNSFLSTVFKPECFAEILVKESKKETTKESTSESYISKALTKIKSFSFYILIFNVLCMIATVIEAQLEEEIMIQQPNEVPNMQLGRNKVICQQGINVQQ